MLAADVEYAGFWIRVGAALIDSVIVIALTFPLLLWIYGWSYFNDATALIAGPSDLLISWVAPAIAIILFWHYKQATPGKMALSLHVVDAESGNTMSFGQSIGRYFGYFVSIIPLCLGLVWVAFDRRKQGWHDKLAGTIVIRSRGSRPEPIRVEQH